ncbi:MAG TPA: endonuclease/exonuclease/phosphatase family protein [Ohtaekwangia sp.]|nr:endonuclease/exonuclease/phosphatase family protein [Ohtaekwangia sp.]
MKTLVFIFLCVSFLASGQSYKLMSYNIRYATAADGVNDWENRKEKVYNLIQRYDPDIIGVQEALHQQLNDLMTNLPDYSYVGVGREDGKKAGEFSAILYKKEKFKNLEDDTFWLSTTPDVPGSKSWDAALTRVASWIKVRDTKNNQVFFVINTHFDHVGAEARKQSAVLIKDQITKLTGDSPAVVMGDFNCLREDSPYQVMINKEGRQLYDPAPENAPGTFCSFGVNSIPCRAIDYIFHTAEWSKENYEVIQDNDGKYYPSDHLPVMVELKLKSKNKRKNK